MVDLFELVCIVGWVAIVLGSFDPLQKVFSLALLNIGDLGHCYALIGLIKSLSLNCFAFSNLVDWGLWLITGT